MDWVDRTASELVEENDMSSLTVGFATQMHK